MRQYDSSISVYLIGSNGALTLGGSPIASGNNSYGLTFDPNGNYIYTVNCDSTNGNSISEYSIGSNGTLTALASSPFSLTNSENIFLLTVGKN
jgi:DNA-binding beta-propeller fold protein YncE